MLQIDFINVGYGDAILLRTGNFTMLVDTGDAVQNITGSGRMDVTSFLKKEQISRLDLLVLTHLHLDHVGQAVPLVNEIAVDELWVNYMPPITAIGRQIPLNQTWDESAINSLESLNYVNQAINILKQKSRIIRVCDMKGLVWQKDGLEIKAVPADSRIMKKHKEVFDHMYEHADEKEITSFAGSVNDTCICLIIRYRENKIVLPGDVPAVLLETYDDIDHADIFKIPHHGAEDSLTRKLLEKLRAKHIVFSVSSDRAGVDGRPLPEMVQPALDSGAEVHFTDAVVYKDLPVKNHHSVRFEIDNGIMVKE